MKGTQGLIVAVGLGICGMLLNYAYLARRAQESRALDFVVVKEGGFAKGARLTAGKLDKVSIPEENSGNLKDVAVLYQDLASVDGMNVWRELPEGSLLLRQDLRTYPQTLELDKDEDIRWIPVDSRAFVPSLVEPGDMVSFVIPKTLLGEPTPVSSTSRATGSGATAASENDTGNMSSTAPETETIGRFKVLSLGNRLSKTDVMRAAKIPLTQENVLGIRVSKKVDGEEERAEKLWKSLRKVNFREVGLVLHSRAGGTP
jgi:hypothetical protein